MQFRRRREQARQCVFLCASLVLLAVCGCPAFFTADPRYRPGRTGASGPGATRRGQRLVADRRRGVLPWPVQGQVVTRFGTVVDPKYGTTTKNTGIDVLTRYGNPVVAVDSGTVSFADIFMGYGRMIIIDHGGRIHSIYSKLHEVKVKVGASVARGSTIALSGDTLHFEFRVSGQSVDPLEWLTPR